MNDGGEDLDALFGPGERPDPAGIGQPADDSRPPGLMWPPEPGYVPPPPPPPVYAVDPGPGESPDDDPPPGGNPFVKLTPRQARLLEAMMIAPTFEAACEQAAVPARTGRRWLADAGFRAAVDRAVVDAIEHGITKLCRHVDEAVGVLAELLKSDREHVRLKAAVAIVTQAMHGVAFKIVKVEYEQFAEWVHKRIERNRKRAGGL